MKKRTTATTSSSAADPIMNPTGGGRGEQEPLLGQPGDAALPEGKPLQYNLIIGESRSLTYI